MSMRRPRRDDRQDPPPLSRNTMTERLADQDGTKDRAPTRRMNFMIPVDLHEAYRQEAHRQTTQEQKQTMAALIIRAMELYQQRSFDDPGPQD